MTERTEHWNRTFWLSYDERMNHLDPKIDAHSDSWFKAYIRNNALYEVGKLFVPVHHQII